MSPADDAEVARLLAEARAKLAELKEVCDEFARAAEAARAEGRQMTREENSAGKRAAYLARYVADCAQRAGHDPKRRRQHTTVPRWTGEKP